MVSRLRWKSGMGMACGQTPPLDASAKGEVKATRYHKHTASHSSSYIHCQLVDMNYGTVLQITIDDPLQSTS